MSLAFDEFGRPFIIIRVSISLSIMMLELEGLQVLWLSLRLVHRH